MTARVENINVAILRQCREQMALSLEEVRGKIETIETIEAGKEYPTFDQLSILAGMYGVPRWVFISEQLPSEYNFVKSVPAFRQFTEQTGETFSDPKVRNVVAQVQQLRELVIDLCQDMDEPIQPFRPPSIEKRSNPGDVADTIRSWLNIRDSLPFQEWKEKLEQKGIFVFMTDKYKGWAHIEKAVFRGLSMYYPVLPVIIINDSDAKKAQPFTLFHELGHLLRKENAVDSWNERNKEVEKWCDNLAGEVLMPENEFRDAAKIERITELHNIERLAGKFEVSSYACLVRLRSMKRISQQQYLGFERQREEKYKKLQRKLKESSGGPPRDRVREVLNQYGHIYARTLYQAYHNKEISLHKLGKAFNLKRASQVLELANRL